jgi:hypothetical protein
VAISTSREFNRYSIALFDLTKALEFATEAKRHPANSLVHEALLLAAIVSYCRPFSGNEKAPDAPATSRLSVDAFGELGDSDREIHARCEILRNKALAHSEFEFNPTRLDTDTGLIVSRPFSLFVQTQGFDLEAFVRLIEKLKSACHTRRADYVVSQRNITVQQ